jgi:hypothetical protein
MENPFVYGEVVPASAFVNRVVELDRLVQDLADGQKVFLISPRRYGKSSLIRQALSVMTRRRALTVEVTVSSFSSYVAFLEGYARAITAAERRRDKARTWLGEAIRSARAEVRYADGRRTGAGALSVSFPSVRTDKEISRLAEEVFALPARLAETSGRKVIVALDDTTILIPFAEKVPASDTKPAHWEVRILRLKQQEPETGLSGTFVSVSQNPEIRVDVRTPEGTWNPVFVKRLSTAKAPLLYPRGYVPLKTNNQELKPIPVSEKGNYVVLLYDDAEGKVQTVNFRDVKFLSAD